MPRPKFGYHLKDGSRVPGVTTIVGRFKQCDGLLQWAFSRGAAGDETLYERRDEAADIGTFVHTRWEAHLTGCPLPDPPAVFSVEMKAQSFRCLNAALRWKEDNGLEIKPFEAPLVSEKYRYGGTPDGLTFGKRGAGIADWKTSRDVYVEQWIQMAAYRQLVIENGALQGDLTDGIHLVRFSKWGQFEHTHIGFDHPALETAWQQFKIFLVAYENDKALKRMT